ncbi:tRNA pseudouridine(55) synthase TruB [Quadrisphaera sp. DSM 44207]|uniref:tRNA pseudouridine(55) synthase TruB n=1 Tax=Quadrisphaera sp. DSM 44207 TaxID=1881057 RepID=UPI000889AD98|nr:tRNA pseudouridine(55) synthase TruB [Quadrisphaera sp. DSM 44207]SDQ76935.1 tRNA pseudouridine55 synthase [Quadrisphaera sp. DSM 44207]
MSAPVPRDPPQAGGAPTEVPPGLLVVDKPSGWTSHDVVARTRRLAGTRRVGHAGTLDPMATGVLVLGLGRATRLLAHVVGADKEYLATVRLGAATVTDDAEAEVVSRADASGVPEDAVRAAVAALTGDLLQVPSSVSAVQVDGRRSYARARAGEDVVLAARPVTVRAFDVLAQRRADLDGTPVLDVDVRVEVTSGTYVRALARDLGAALGVGGHLTALRRTRVGSFGLDAAADLRRLEADGVAASLLALPDAARAAFPVWDVDAGQARRLAHGQRLPAEALPDGAPGGGQEPSGPVAAISPDGRLVALVERTGGAVRPVLVLAEPADLP